MSTFYCGQFISDLCGKSASGNHYTRWRCTNNSSSPRASFFTEQRSETRKMTLAERRYITLNNAIKIEDVEIFYPFPVVAVGWLLCKRSPTYRVSVLGYAYALHFPAPDRPSRNFNPLRSFTSRHAEHNCPDMAGYPIHLSGKASCHDLFLRAV